MSQLDDRLKNVFNSEEERILEELPEELGFAELIAESFKGKLKFVVICTTIFILILTAGFIYAFVQAYYAQDGIVRLTWLAIGGLLLLIQAICKIWYWMHLNKITLLRELKRLELQVSLINGRSQG